MKNREVQHNRKYRWHIFAILFSVMLIFAFGLNWLFDINVRDLLTSQTEYQLLAVKNSEGTLLDEFHLFEAQVNHSPNFEAAILELKSDGSQEVLADNFDNRSLLQSILRDLRQEPSNQLAIQRSKGAYYVAYPYEEAGSQYRIIQSFSRPYFSRIARNYWQFFLLVFILIVIAGLLIVHAIQSLFIQPLNEINQILQQFIEGDYSPIYYRSEIGAINDIGHTVNDLQVNFKSRHRQVVANEQRLELLLNQLNLGVVLLDKKGRVELNNPAAKELLGLPDQVEGKSYKAIFKSFVLVRMIDTVFQTNKALSDEIEMFVPDSKFIDVNIVPYRTRPNSKSTSMLVLLYDVSQVHRLETVRSEFVANASHELRTPVTSIKGFAETLLDGALESKDVAYQFVEIIASESERLETIINDTLELSRVETHSVELVVTEFDLVAIIDFMVDFFEAKAEERGMTIEANIQEDQIMLRGDQHRIEQIFTNLIENALNYAGSNSFIEIGAHSSELGVEFYVLDNGIGIPEKDQERIFERFYRVDKGRSRSSGGTGLGLSIVRNLVEYLGGEIEVKSELGKGSVFTIWLPYSY